VKVHFRRAKRKDKYMVIMMTKIRGGKGDNKTREPTIKRQT